MNKPAPNRVSPEADQARRRLLKAGVCAVVAVPLAGLLASRPSQAQTKVDPNSQQAKALNYVEDASEAQRPEGQEDAVCANCVLFVQSQAEGGYAPCQAFMNQAVSAKGWCTSWAAKPA